MNEPLKVEYTGLIPICPYCQVPTKRTSHGCTRTAMGWSPVYGEDGKPIGHDPNTTRELWVCQACGNDFMVKTRSGITEYEGLKQKQP